MNTAVVGAGIAPGLAVRFRVRISPGGAATLAVRARRGDPAPRPSIRVTGFTPAASDPIDDGTDDGRLTVGRFVIAIELAPRPPMALFPRIAAALAEGLRFKILAAALTLEDAVKTRLSATSGVDTGALAGDIQARFDDDGLGASVGTDLAYARYVEFGTRARAARPFLFPALEAQKPMIEVSIRRAAEGRFALLTGAPLTTDRLGFPRLTGDPDLDSDIIWNLYFYGKRPPIPPSSTEVDPASAQVGADIEDILANRSRFSETALKLAREALRILDEQMRNPANSPAGPPDLPPPMPPLGGAPAHGPRKSRIRSGMAFVKSVAKFPRVVRR